MTRLTALTALAALALTTLAGCECVPNDPTDRLLIHLPDIALDDERAWTLQVRPDDGWRCTIDLAALDPENPSPCPDLLLRTYGVTTDLNYQTVTLDVVAGHVDVLLMVDDEVWFEGRVQPDYTEVLPPPEGEGLYCSNPQVAEFVIEAP